jgi:hypothetical protein
LFGSTRKKRPYGTRLLLEVLEDRYVPTTITPTTFADGVLGSGSLRDAVLQFNTDTGSGDDTIQLLSGTYALTIKNMGGRHETAGLTGDLNLTQPSHRWIIQGAGSATIIDASQLQDRVFQIVNPGTQVVFQDLVIQGGLAQDDGSDGALAGSTDALGGGIFNNAGNVTLDNVVVQNSMARGGDAPSGTGHNALGGGFYSTGGALTISGATIAKNQAIGGRGGDAPYAGAGGSGGGGGLYATGGSLDISGSRIASNRAIGGGGGDGSPSAPGGAGGTAQGGGLYANRGSLTISTSNIAANQATGGSGGTWYGGSASGSGGGMYNNGTLTLTGTTVSANSATGSDSAGGGIYNTGTLTVSNSTLSGNSATGGILAGGGGGIFNYGTLTVSNSTLSGNTATFYGGGLYVYSPSNPPVLHNTLIAGNFNGATGTTGDDVRGALNPSGDYNLIGDGTGMTGLSDGVNGNLVGSAAAPIDPVLGPLQDNGGPTQTMALGAGSPAIDAGNNAYATDWDQRGEGFPRIFNGIIDIGAFEYQGAGSAPLFTSSVRGNQPAAGAPFDVTVLAVDAFGQVAFAYTGTLTFRVMDTDPAVVLPLEYIFTADDQGRHTFGGAFTLIAPGDQPVTVADLADGLSTDVTLTVNP